MASVQHNVYDTPTVLLSRCVSGEEEVPLGATCVITPDAPDVLAHISVRARQLGVLFAACFDQDQIEALTSLDGKMVACITDGASISVTESSGGGGAPAQVSMPSPPPRMSAASRPVPPRTGLDAVDAPPACGMASGCDTGPWQTWTWAQASIRC